MKIANKVVMTLAGLLLIAASVLKIIEAFNLCVPGWREHGLWESYEFLLVQLPLELSLGIWLISGLFRRVAWLVSTLAFLGFIGVTLYKGLLGDESCGCFGQIHVSPWMTLGLIDIPMFLLLLINRPGKEYRFLPPPWPNTVHAIVFAVPIFAVLIFVAPAMVAFRPDCVKPGQMNSQNPVVITKYVYIQQPAADPNSLPIVDSQTPHPMTDANSKPVEPNIRQPNNPDTLPVQLSSWLEHIDIADQLKQGIVVILMYHHDCPVCATMVPKYDQYYRTMRQQNDDSMTFVFVAIPPYKEQGPVPADTLCLQGRLKERPDGKLWAITSPYVIALIDGQQIKSWKEGTAPSPDALFEEITAALSVSQP
jgi:hypothetical protein